MDLPNVCESAALKPSRKAPVAFTKVVVKGKVKYAIIWILQKNQLSTWIAAEKSKSPTALRTDRQSELLRIIASFWMLGS